MRTILVLALIAISTTFIACNSSGSKSNTDSQSVETTTKNTTNDATQHAKLAVGGSCGMCTDRIINTVNEIDGIISSSYDLEKQELNIDFDDNKTSIDDISKSLAEVGHDTDLYKADQNIYDALPGCCKYRKS